MFIKSLHFCSSSLGDIPPHVGRWVEHGVCAYGLKTKPFVQAGGRRPEARSRPETGGRRPETGKSETGNGKPQTGNPGSVNRRLENRKPESGN